MFGTITQIYRGAHVAIEYYTNERCIKYKIGTAVNSMMIRLDSDLRKLHYYEESKDLIVVDDKMNYYFFVNKINHTLKMKLNTRETITLVDSGIIVRQIREKIELVLLKKDKFVVLTEISKPRALLSQNEYSILYKDGKASYVVTKDNIYPFSGMKYKLFNHNHIRDQKDNLDSSLFDASNSSLCLSPEIDYNIRYNIKSDLLLCEYNDDSLRQITLQRDGEVANIVAVKFIKPNVFGSLDQAGRFDIWRIGNKTAKVENSYFPYHFPHKRVYHSFKLTKNKQNICFIFDNQRDEIPLCPDGIKLLFHAMPKSIEQQIGKETNNKDQQLEEKQKPLPKKPDTKKPSVPKIETNEWVHNSFFIPNQTGSTHKNIDDSHVENQKSQSLAVAKMEKRIPSSPFRRSKVKIYIGIDFGSSRSKISINNEMENRYNPLDFPELIPPNRTLIDDFDHFVIPSIALKEGNTMYYGYDACTKEGQVLINLKQEALKPNATKFSLSVCIGLLSYMMHIARDKAMQMLNTNEQDQYIFSICLPVEQMNSNLIAGRFKYLSAHAKHLMEKADFRDYNKLKEALLSKKIYKSTEHDIQPSIIPESIAEVLDFLQRSDQSGLFAMYDFGAGTTDLTIFYLNRHSGKAEIIEATIIHKGYHEIDRLKQSQNMKQEQVQNHYQSILNDIQESGIWERTKTKISGAESMRFFYEIRILGSGGGVNDPIVRKLFSKIPLYDQNTQEFIHRELEILNEPADWDPSLPQYYRYAVSFGLTKKPEETLERFGLPKDFEARDYSPPVREKEHTDPTVTRDWLVK